MGVPVPITALRAVRALVPDQNDTTLLPVAWAIDAWLSGGGDFAEALGLAPGWHSALRQRQHDEALRELATRHFPGLCGRKADWTQWRSDARRKGCKLIA
jgi:hypothetical protein